MVHVAHKVEFKTSYKVLIKNLSGRDTIGDQGIDAIGLKCNFKEIGRVGVRFQKGINLMWMETEFEI